MNVFPRQKLLLLLLLPFLSACAPFVKDGQPLVSNTKVILSAGQNVGQTFVARDAGLSGVEIFLAPETSGAGTLQLHLRDSATSQTDVATASLSLQQVTAPAFYRFEFSPRGDSFKHAYYFLIELNDAGKIKVGTAAGDVFLDGAMYQNGNPVDAQTAFRLAYDPPGLATGLLAQIAGWVGIVLIGLFLYVLPGLGLLTFFWRGAEKFSWGEKLGLSAGISIALYPLFLLWTHLVGLQLGALYAWLPPLAALAFLMWHYRDAGRVQPVSRAFGDWRRSEHFLPDLVFLILIGLILFTRFWVIRSLDIPMWGDSYQHTMIAQLIADNGGLFDSWQPYTEIQSLTYHFGFHTAAAMFHWVSGMEMPSAVLWFGQLLNVLAVLTLYPLAVRIGNNRWAGVGAVLVAGLLTQMPMFYVNWGRYTQLAGQAILPAAVVIAWAAWESNNRDWRLVALAWLVIAGLAVTHYRILIFFIFLTAVLMALNARRKDFRSVLTEIALVGFGAFLLFVPWFLHTFDSLIAENFTHKITTPADAVPIFLQQYNSMGDLLVYLPAWIWIVAGLSIAFGVWRRKLGMMVVTLWWLLVLLAANPQWLKLPGVGILSNFAVLIVLYIPAGVLMGAALSWAISERSFALRWQWLALVVGVGILGLWGTRERLGDVQIVQGVLATPADARAAEWIQKNTPSNARFLVNSFAAYGDTSIVGSDGGWWLPLLAHRQTTVPPLTYASEQGPRPDYRLWINALPIEIRKQGVKSMDVINLLHERGVTYLYIGQRQGRVNTDGASALSPEQLLASGHFLPVYHQDRVWVFAIP